MGMRNYFKEIADRVFFPLYDVVFIDTKENTFHSLILTPPGDDRVLSLTSVNTIEAGCSFTWGYSK